MRANYNVCQNLLAWYCLLIPVFCTEIVLIDLQNNFRLERVQTTSYYGLNKEIINRSHK